MPVDPYAVIDGPPQPAGGSAPDPYAVIDGPPQRPPGPATIAEQLAAKAKARGTETPVLDAVETFADSLQRGVANVYTGAAKKAGNTLFGLGKLVRDYTPIGRVSDLISPGAFDTPLPELETKGALQGLGGAAEQVAEFFLPTGAPARAVRAAELAKTALLTQAQARSPETTAVATGLSAVTPTVVRAAARLAPGLRASAEKTVAQALGATKEQMKTEAARLAPQMLDRGVRGTRAQMLAQASAQTRAVGQLIEREIADQAAAGATVNGNQLRGAVQIARDALHIPDATGTRIPIRGAEPAIRELQALDDFVAQLGPDIPFEHAQRIKQTWQHIVSKAGLYGPKATATATDAAAASALREGAGVMREMLASGSATLDDLNREFGFWKGLQTVLRATEQRTQAQSGGLVSAGVGGAGATAGFLSGDDFMDSLQRAVGVGLLSRQVIRGVQSPWFRTTVAAPLRNALAEAIAAGNQGQVRAAAARIVAAMPSALRNATEP